MGKRILGLTLTQPWATLVATGEKQIETRSWGSQYRGLVAIHASKAFPLTARELMTTPPFHAALDRHGYTAPGDLPTGEILALVELIAVRSTGTDGIDEDWIQQLSEQEKAFGDYSPERFGWLLKNALLLPQPVPCKGALSLWAIPDDVRAAIERQVL